MGMVQYYLPLVVIVASSHTRMVVRDFFKGDEASQWKRPKFDPLLQQNPVTDLRKIGRREYVLDGTQYAKFCSDRFMGILQYKLSPIVIVAPHKLYSE